MKTTCSRGILVGAFALCVSSFHICPRIDCQSNSNAAVKMTESVVIAKIGVKSDCGDCNHDTLELSPDGAYLAHLHSDYGASTTEGGNTVEVSDVRSGRIVANFSIPTPPDAAWSGGYGAQVTDHIRYCDSGKYVLASVGFGKVYVLDTKTYRPHTVIDINYAAIRATPIGKSGAGLFAQISCAADGNVAAILVRGVTKIFSLATGEEIRQPDGLFSRSGIREVVVSPSGHHLAILQYIDNWEIILIDMQTKTIRSQISFGGSSYNPYDYPVMFAGESMVAMMQAEKSAGNVHPTDSSGYYGRQSLKFWNAGSASEVQVIKNLDPGANDVRFWGISADGRTVLASTGKVSGKELDRVRDARFSLWDSESGKMIAQSPSLKLIHHGCPFDIFRLGKCTSFDETPRLTMSQSGNAVATWWASGGEPVIVYTLGPLTPSH